MRKLIIVVASLLVVVLFILQGFQQTHPLPEPDNNRQSTATSEGIADALDAIYFDVSIMGVQDATAERLASDFGVDTSCLSAVYGRYTDGRFGIADVILVVQSRGRKPSAAICWSPYAPAGPVFLPIMISTAPANWPKTGSSTPWAITMFC